MARPKILLVDDNKDFLKIASEFLDSKGYEVVTTTDPEEGRRLLEGGAFAVAFLDVRFDEQDDRNRKGLALAIETMGTSSVPKVIMTVLTEAEYVRESLRWRQGGAAAAVDFLHKKDGLQQMADTIESIVRRARVFLSYADPDRAEVTRLYHDLQMSGFLPWMDKMDIEAGELWETAVRGAIRKTDFVVIVLSKGSVDRSGYFQKEISMALDILKEQPPDKIFLIPARLEECETPHEGLRELHRVDLFSPGGYDRLVRALNEGINRRN
jgi:CheY-like chemotaxis protein